MDINNSRFEVLSYNQVKKLDTLFSQPIAIKSRENSSCLTVCLRDLVPQVLRKLSTFGISVTDVRLNGGAASYVVRQNINSVDTERDYADLDLIFGIDELASHESLQSVREAVIEVVQSIVSKGKQEGEVFNELVQDAYIQKMIKVCSEQDCWSLISLGYIFNPSQDINVELKFVGKMKRQFEFSVDSFQIILDSLLSFYDVSSTEVTEDDYPTVKAESVYGDITEALYHLDKKLITTKSPEQIRGGGLLKYCYLRSKGYRSDNLKEDNKLQRYMCSRFFIDFKDIAQQKARLESYLAIHFGPERYEVKIDYLKILHSVIYRSTVCLMCHEHQQILCLLVQMIHHLEQQEENRANLQEMFSSQFDWQNQNNLIIDQVFYGYCFDQSNDYNNSGSISPIPWPAIYTSPVAECYQQPVYDSWCSSFCSYPVSTSSSSMSPLPVEESAFKPGIDSVQYGHS